eukprot:gene3609-4493_t
MIDEYVGLTKVQYWYIVAVSFLGTLGVMGWSQLFFDIILGVVNILLIFFGVRGMWKKKKNLLMIFQWGITAMIFLNVIALVVVFVAHYKYKKDSRYAFVPDVILDSFRVLYSIGLVFLTQYIRSTLDYKRPPAQLNLPKNNDNNSNRNSNVQQKAQIKKESFHLILSSLVSNISSKAAIDLLDYLHSDQSMLKDLFLRFNHEGYGEGGIDCEAVRNWLFDHRSEYQYSGFILNQFMEEAIKSKDLKLVKLYFDNDLFNREHQIKYIRLAVENSSIGQCDESLEIIRFLQQNHQNKFKLNFNINLRDVLELSERKGVVRIYEYLLDQHVKSKNAIWLPRSFNLEIIKFLWENPKYQDIKSKMINTTDTDYDCHFNDIQTVKYFYDNKIIKLTNESINRAIESGNLQVFKFLYSHRSEEFIPKKQSLFTVIDNGNIQMLKYLVENVPECQKVSFDIYLKGVKITDRFIEILEYFQSLSPPVNTLIQDIRFLSLNATKRAVNLKLSKTSRNDIFKSGNLQQLKILDAEQQLVFGWDEVKIAASHGRIDMLRYLFEVKKIDEVSDIIDWITTINRAYLNGNYELVKWIFSSPEFQGILFNTMNRKLMKYKFVKLLILLFQYGHLEMIQFFVQMLQSNPAVKTISSKFIYGFFFNYTQCASLKILKYLLQVFPFDPTQINLKLLFINSKIQESDKMALFLYLKEEFILQKILLVDHYQVVEFFNIVKFIYNEIKTINNNARHPPVEKQQLEIQRSIFGRVIKPVEVSKTKDPKVSEYIISLLEYLHHDHRDMLKKLFLDVPLIDHTLEFPSKVWTWLVNFRSEYTYSGELRKQLTVDSIKTGNLQLVKLCLENGLFDKYKYHEYKKAANYLTAHTQQDIISYLEKEKDRFMICWVATTPRNIFEENWEETDASELEHKLDLYIETNQPHLVGNTLRNFNLPLIKLIWENPKYQEMKRKISTMKDHDIPNCFFNDIPTLKYFHENRVVQFTKYAMTRAANLGYLDGCVGITALEKAMECNHIEVVNFLRSNRTECQNNSIQITLDENWQINDGAFRSLELYPFNFKKIEIDLQRMGNLSLYIWRRAIQMYVKFPSKIEISATSTEFLFTYGDLEKLKCLQTSLDYDTQWKHLEIASINVEKQQLEFQRSIFTRAIIRPFDGDRSNELDYEYSINLLEYLHHDHRDMLKKLLSDLHLPYQKDQEVKFPPIIRTWLFNHRSEYTYSEEIQAQLTIDSIKTGDLQLVKTCIENGFFDNYKYHDYLKLASNISSLSSRQDIISYLEQEKGKFRIYTRISTSPPPKDLFIDVWEETDPTKIETKLDLFLQSKWSQRDAVSKIIKYSRLHIIKLIWENPKYQEYKNIMSQMKDLDIFNCFDNDIRTLKYFHENNIIEFTDYSMTEAAENGYLDILKFLHFNRTEGCVGKTALEKAMGGYNFEMFKFLHENRPECQNINNIKICPFWFKHENTIQIMEFFPFYFLKDVQIDIKKMENLSLDVWKRLTQLMYSFKFSIGSSITDFIFQYGDIEKLKILVVLGYETNLKDLRISSINGRLSMPVGLLKLMPTISPPKYLNSNS